MEGGGLLRGFCWGWRCSGFRVRLGGGGSETGNETKKKPKSTLLADKRVDYNKAKPRLVASVALKMLFLNPYTKDWNKTLDNTKYHIKQLREMRNKGGFVAMGGGGGLENKKKPKITLLSHFGGGGVS